MTWSRFISDPILERDFKWMTIEIIGQYSSKNPIGVQSLMVMILLLKTSSESSYYYTEISSSLNLAVEFT